ncbi:MAG: serine--tRNA ligase [Rhodospirillales bacterium]|nr:serine--tRNA ligase [Rhodospirillales bacterium]
MHDIKYIRENPNDFDAAMERRGLDGVSAEILALDEDRRAVQTTLQELQAQRNAESRRIGDIKKAGGDASAAMDSVSTLKNEMADLEDKERALGEGLQNLLAGLPNILAGDVPDGADEDENVELRYWPPHPNPLPAGERGLEGGPDHAEIGEKLGMMDFETAAKMSGSRFTLLSGGLARMERAIGMFFLDVHTSEHGYTEVSPPLMIRDNAMFGTGQLPKFAEDQFCTTRGDWLLPTSEVPLTNIVAEMIVEEEYLPRRYTAFTPCFRQEAGAAGKDTRGMLRQHQFYKVEMVSVTVPEDSEAEHERMVGCAEAVLKKLEIPFRTIVLCSGDTGFGARKTYDIEAWLPGQETYREISSVSNCWDFQARRMNARCRAKGEKQTRFVHTLNGSGVAVGRALIAVMENYHDPSDGGIWVPEVLKPYMGGLEKIVKD